MSAHRSLSIVPSSDTETSTQTHGDATRLTADALAEQIGARCVGDPTCLVEGCARLGEATADHVSFLANSRYRDKLKSTNAAVVILAPDDVAVVGEPAADSGRALLVADDPYFAFREAVVALHGHQQHPNAIVSPYARIDHDVELGFGVSIQPFAVIEPGAKIGKNTVIYPHCYVGKNATIGDDCVLYPNVTIYENCVLHNRVTLHAGTVIGQDGFGYATHPPEDSPESPPIHHKIPPIGNVVIEDDVEMGANCAVDRATMGATVIGKGTKFSDMVTVAHGSDIGPHNLFVAQVGIAGSVTTGRYVAMGGQAGVAPHLTVADGVQIAAKAGVTRDLTEPGAYGGMPAVEISLIRRSWMAMLRLPALLSDFRTLNRRVAQLEKQLEKREG